MSVREQYQHSLDCYRCSRGYLPRVATEEELEQADRQSNLFEVDVLAARFEGVRNER